MNNDQNTKGPIRFQRSLHKPEPKLLQIFTAFPKKLAANSQGSLQKAPFFLQKIANTSKQINQVDLHTLLTYSGPR